MDQISFALSLKDPIDGTLSDMDKAMLWERARKSSKILPAAKAMEKAARQCSAIIEAMSLLETNPPENPMVRAKLSFVAEHAAWAINAWETEAVGFRRSSPDELRRSIEAAVEIVAGLPIDHPARVVLENASA